MKPDAIHLNYVIIEHSKGSYWMKEESLQNHMGWFPNHLQMFLSIKQTCGLSNFRKQILLQTYLKKQKQRMSGWSEGMLTL